MKIKILLIFTLLFAGCKKDNPEPSNPGSGTFSAANTGVYISNEGGFGNSNSSVSYYNQGNTIADVYKQVNNEDLGDICQSMTRINDELYLVINNSSKIEVVNAITMKKIATISGLSSPRYITQVSATKAYVSDFISNFISIIDLASHTVTGTISVHSFTETMILSNNKAYVACGFSPYVYLINPTTDQLEDSILISYGGNSIVEDANNKLWVLATGDYIAIPGGLHRIDPVTNTPELSLSFPFGEFPSRLTINGSGNELYFLNGGVVKMDISDNTIPSGFFIPANSRSLYGLGFDTSTNNVFISDAIDFQQNGKVYMYDSSANEVGSFTAGVAPGNFLFL